MLVKSVILVLTISMYIFRNSLCNCMLSHLRDTRVMRSMSMTCMSVTMYDVIRYDELYDGKQCYGKLDS